MRDPLSETETITVRLARDNREIEAAQQLRYKVFYEEYAATPTPEMLRLKRDMDEFDSVADHLIVLDHSDSHEGQIVGTYRLLRRDAVEKKNQGFYSSTEFNIAPLLSSGAQVLELGRSCVMEEYRTRPILQLLWQGIADYVMDYDVGLLFGCASLPGTDVTRLSQQLAYLHHYHLAPESIRPSALPERYVEMNIHAKDSINARDAFQELPTLVKGYLRTGAVIGSGAVIDHQFNTTDVCIVLQTSLLTSRYRKHYERTTQREFSPQPSAQQPQPAAEDMPAYACTAAATA